MKEMFTLGMAILQEIAYLISYPITIFFYNPKKIKTIPTKGTIVLVETWFHKNPFHKLWSIYLERKGFTVHLINLSNMMESFPKTAAKLNTYIEKHQLTRFTLVGISTASLVCLEYLHTYHKWHYVKKFISIAAPFKGTSHAVFIAYTHKGKDMIPESKFLKKLLKQPIPKGKMVTISAAIDEIVPTKSSMLPGIPAIVLPALGHNVLHLDYQQTYDEIAAIAQSE